MTNKAKAEFYKNEYMAQFRINKNLLAEIEKLKAEIEKLKAAADAELDTIHNLGDDYERVLEEEAQHIREAKIEAVKELGNKLIDNCHKGVISAADIFDIVYGYVKKGGDGV